MRYIIVFGLLFFFGCTLEVTDGFDKNKQPQVLNTDVVRLNTNLLQNDVSVAEYKHGTTTYLIFKCGDQLFIQKAEDTASGK